MLKTKALHNSKSQKIGGFGLTRCKSSERVDQLHQEELWKADSGLLTATRDFFLRRLVLLRAVEPLAAKAEHAV